MSFISPEDVRKSKKGDIYSRRVSAESHKNMKFSAETVGTAVTLKYGEHHWKIV